MELKNFKRDLVNSQSWHHGITDRDLA